MACGKGCPRSCSAQPIRHRGRPAVSALLACLLRMAAVMTASALLSVSVTIWRERGGGHEGSAGRTHRPRSLIPMKAIMHAPYHVPPPGMHVCRQYLPLSIRGGGRGKMPCPLHQSGREGAAHSRPCLPSSRCSSACRPPRQQPARNNSNNSNASVTSRKALVFNTCPAMDMHLWASIPSVTAIWSLMHRSTGTHYPTSRAAPSI